MPRDGSKTKTKILDAALQLSMKSGLASTSIDEVIKQAGITKGTFFYHFKTKQDLANKLVRHFARHDQQSFNELTERAEKLSRDPLQQVLLMVGLISEWFTGSDMRNPGCLFASLCYQDDLWTEEVRVICHDQLGVWTDWVERRLKLTAKERPPRIKANLHAVAEMFNGVFEGAFVLARTSNNPGVITEQLLAYRDYLELLFDTGSAKAPKKSRSR